MQAQELLQRIKAKNPPAIIDVRSGSEFNSGHIPGAIHVPTWKILLRLGDIPADKNTEMVVLCEIGPRAQVAMGILNTIGYKNVTLLSGHMSAWRQAGLPLHKS